jgi:hypothetical protein
MDAYRRALDDPGAVEAMCEDYRGGASEDVALDEADREARRRIACPVLVLWAAHGGLPKAYADVLEVPAALGVRRSRQRTGRRPLPRGGPPGGDGDLTTRVPAMTPTNQEVRPCPPNR